MERELPEDPNANALPVYRAPLPASSRPHEAEDGPEDGNAPHQLSRHRSRRHHRVKGRHRGRTVLRGRMRFAWWQLWITALAVALTGAIILAMQPWKPQRAEQQHYG